MYGAKKVDSVRQKVVWDYAEVLGVIALVTIGGWFTPLNYHAFGYLYLLAVVALSLHIRRVPVLIGAVVSGLTWNFVFVPPRLSFSVLHLDDTILLSCYFVVALIGSQLAALRSADDRARLLADSERMHQTLLDNVAHELKTPITVFRSALDQLRTAEATKREELLGELRIAVNRLDDVVGNLLHQTRLESGMLKAKLDWCDVGDLVAAARRAVGRRLEGRSLAVEIPSNCPIVRADAVLMEQSIAHLLVNAAVHTPPGTAIRVGAATSPDLSRMIIQVADDGPGVAPEFRDRIFDKFSQGPSGRSRGLGLGLSIVRGFMQAQGGDATFVSPAGGGARFELSLPYTPGEAVPHA
jgi:K+-sensing histidine kinase KdpD